MGHFIDIVRRIGLVGTFVGAAFLVGVMLLVVGNIILRLLGGVIPGTWELVELLMCVTIGFAIVYTGVQGGHVVIKILTDRFSLRVQAFLKIMSALICLGILASMVWAIIDWIREVALLGVERTDLLGVQVAPFKSIWAASLILCCLVVLVELLVTVRQGEKK